MIWDISPEAVEKRRAPRADRRQGAAQRTGRRAGGVRPLLPCPARVGDLPGKLLYTKIYRRHAFGERISE